MRLLIVIIAAIAATYTASAQVPSVTGNSTVKLTENNNIFYRSISDVFAAIDVDLTTGVTGTLPVANGGTGATTFTNNRLLTGNGTSAIVDEANATFDGTTLTITGKEVIAGTGSYSADASLLSISGTTTTTANGVDIHGVNSSVTAENDGTPTSNSFRGATYGVSTNTTTSGILYGQIMGVTNTSPNVSQAYGMSARLDENSASGDLSTRYGLDFLLVKGAQDGADVHTFTGLRVRTQDGTSTGRVKSSTGFATNVDNALTGVGMALTLNNNRGTGNTQTGIQITNLVSGTGVTTTTAYGLRLLQTESSSGAHGTYYGLHLGSSPVATTNYFAYNSTDFRNYLNGNLAIGVDVTTAKLFVRGSGATSGTSGLIVENSAGTDIFNVRDDLMSAFGTTPVSTEKLVVRGATSDNTTKAFVAERSSGTDVLGVQNDGKVSVNNAAYTEALTVNGNTQTDMIILTNQTASTATGKVVYDNGSGGTFSGTMSLGDGTHALVMAPTLIERHVLDYLVNWSTGRKGAFWTVPARFDGYKIAKAYISVTAIGAGAGDDELTIEIGGVGEGVQVITAGTHTLVMNDVINTDDVITFNITAISATPAQGLHVSFELSKL